MFRLLSYQESWKDVYTSRTASAALNAASHQGSDHLAKSVCEIVLAKEPEAAGKRSRLLTVLAVAEPTWVGPFVASYLTARVSREIDALVFQDQQGGTSPERKIREVCLLLDGMLASVSATPVKKARPPLGLWLCCLCSLACVGLLAWFILGIKQDPVSTGNSSVVTKAQMEQLKDELAKTQNAAIQKLREETQVSQKALIAEYQPFQGESISLDKSRRDHKLNVPSGVQGSQVLVYCRVHSGGAEEADEGYLEVTTISKSGMEYSQKLFIQTWQQQAVSFSSDYFWLPWPKSGKVKVGFIGFKQAISPNLAATVEIVGWR